MKTKNVHCALLLAVLVVSLVVYAGHAHPTPTPQTATTQTPPSTASTETKPEAMPFMVDFPNYHPLIVHFPIVLLIVGAVFQVLSFVMYRKEFGMVTLLLLLTGTISAWLASNVFHVHVMNLTESAAKIFETHELMAKYTFWLAIAAIAAKAVSHFYLNRKWWSEAVVLILLVGASITVSIAGHRGAQLVHMEGVGPQGKYLESHQH